MKSFSELTSASHVNNSDILAISQENSGTYSSKKTTVKEVSDFANQNLAEEYDSTSSYAVGDYCIYESVLYKCTASTTGSFDNTKWTPVYVTDEMGSGGGGAGHTILDDDGTALAQQSDLQFKGAYSRNNSTDGITEVNVFREMTKQEFDNLSDDEKVGFIKTTDEPDIASIVDGVFIDTDNLITSGTLSNSGTTSYTATEDCYFIGYASSGNALAYLIDNVTMIFAPTNQTHSLLLKKGQILTIGEASTYSVSYKIYGIQQGSNVVKYNYSTEEQIVGTWIDGSTLYQKTIDFGNLPATTLKSVNTDVNNIGLVTKVNGFAYSSGATINIPYIESNNTSAKQTIDIWHNKSTNKVDINTNFDASGFYGYVTIQYTKSSS